MLSSDVQRVFHQMYCWWLTLQMPRCKLWPKMVDKLPPVNHCLLRPQPRSRRDKSQMQISWLLVQWAISVFSQVFQVQCQWHIMYAGLLWTHLNHPNWDLGNKQVRNCLFTIQAVRAHPKVQRMPRAPTMWTKCWAKDEEDDCSWQEEVVFLRWGGKTLLWTSASQQWAQPEKSNKWKKIVALPMRFSHNNNYVDHRCLFLDFEFLSNNIFCFIPTSFLCCLTFCWPSNDKLKFAGIKHGRVLM